MDVSPHSCGPGDTTQLALGRVNTRTVSLCRLHALSSDDSLALQLKTLEVGSSAVHMHGAAEGPLARWSWAAF